MANTDYFVKVGDPGTATTLSAPGHLIGGDSITVVSTANYSTDTIFAIDTVTIVNGEEVRNAGSYTEWQGVVSGATTIDNMVLRYGTDQNYSAGATTRVYIPVSSSRENRLVDGLEVEHLQTGKHNAITAASVVVADGGNLEVDHILEAEAAHGVVIDGLSIKDGALVTANSVPQSVLDTTAGKGPLKSKLISITRDGTAASGDVSYTGVGFIPSSLVAFARVDGTLYRSDGASDAARGSSSTYQSAANVYYVNPTLIAYSNQSTWGQSAIVKSYDADGFTLTWGKVGSPSAGTIKADIICYR